MEALIILAFFDKKIFPIRHHTALMNYTAKSILLLEDDTDDFEIFEHALGEYSAGYELTMVKDGHSLLQLLNHLAPPDIIVLDLNVPRVTGMDCLKKIRLRQSLDAIPVYVLTGSSDPLEMENCLAAGATKFFIKPINYSATKIIVKEICGHLPGLAPANLSF